MRYKKGDKVRIKPLSWYNQKKDVNGDVFFTDPIGIVFVETMSKYCGKVVTIDVIEGNAFTIKEDDRDFWFDFNSIDEEVDYTKQTMTMNEFIRKMKQVADLNTWDIPVLIDDLPIKSIKLETNNDEIILHVNSTNDEQKK